MMARRSIICVAILLALAVIVKPSSAAMCAPGQGIKKFDLLSAVSGLLGGGAPRSGPTCQPCRFGTASAGGQDAECQMCTPFVSAPNFLRTSCDCLPGSYLASRPESWTTVVKNCTACPKNHISTTKNAAECIACPAGSIADGEKCVCPSGFAATGLNGFGVAGCTACADVQVSSGGLSQECLSCEAGSYPLEDKSACGCPAGNRLASNEPLTCAPCSTVFEYTTATNRMLMCMQCLPYSYANSDHTSCECAAGYYTNNADAKAVVCRQCPEGTYKASTGNGNVTACLACPAGLTSSGSRRSCVAPPCPVGTEKAADGSCIQCAETHFNHLRDGKCQQCPNNTLANPGRTLCDMCAPGALQTSQAGEELSCMSCMFGFKKDDYTNACVEDPHAKLETDPHNPTLPTQHDEHPVEAIPVPTNPSLPGAGAATEPVETKPEVQPPAGITTVRTTPGQGSTNMLKLAVSPSSGAATLSTVKAPVAPARRFAFGGSGRIA